MARSIHKLLPGGCTRLPVHGCAVIAKLRVGQEAYHLSGVAQSLGDYYSGAGETHGQWIGGGASRLGLDGQVDPDDLRAVLAGLRRHRRADPER